MSESKIIGCAWMFVKDAAIVTCGSLPTTQAKNSLYYCEFHYKIAKNMKPFERSPCAITAGKNTDLPKS